MMSAEHPTTARGAHRQLTRRKGPRARSALLLGSLVLLASACGADAEPEAPVVAAQLDTALLGAESVAIGGFTLDTARLAPWTATGMAPARVVLDPARHQTLGSIVEGRVSEVYVRVGDAVRAGDILVAIHSHEIMDARAGLVRAETQLRSARAERDAAEIARQRAERLLTAKAASQAEVERAVVLATSSAAMLEEAEAEAVRARGLIEHLLGDGPLPDHLDPHDVLIRAPISGMIVERSVIPGQVVLPGEPLVAVADPRALQLELRLTDRQLDGIVPGAAITFTLVGESSDAAVGRAVVSRVSPVVDDATRSTVVIANITNAPPGTRAERFATAQLSGLGGPEVLRVPVTAVQALAGDTIVILAEQRGEGLHIAAAPVRVGRRDAMFAEILVGLDAGQVIIAHGATIARAELLKRRQGAGGE
jgi:membrane fusion protein, heavy metal efflux system